VIGSGCGVPGVPGDALVTPRALRFTADGGCVAVPVVGRGGVWQFRTEDGGFVGHAVHPEAGLQPTDVVEVGAGWLVTCAATNTVQLVGGVGGGRAPRCLLGTPSPSDTQSSRLGQYPVAVSLAPGLGLVMRELGNNDRLQVRGLVIRVSPPPPHTYSNSDPRGEHPHPARVSHQVFSLPEWLAMGGMSPTRVAWMGAVARAGGWPGL
jgi:hypothetical protein